MKKTIFHWLLILSFLMGGLLSVWPITTEAGEVSTKGQITLVDETTRTTTDSSASSSSSDTSETTSEAKNTSGGGSGNGSGDTSGKLPSTGELLTKSLGISGGMLLFVAFFFYRKNRQPNKGGENE